MRLLPCGRTGLLVELDDLDQVRALYAALVTDRPPGVVDLVPAARTVLLHLDPARADAAAVERALRSALGRAGGPPEPGPPGGRVTPAVTVPVCYDGPDLDEVAAHLGMSRAEVVGWHTGADWTVAFCGFAPGFGYLVRAGQARTVPRRRDPRTRVPAGAVGLAGEFGGVYPRESPGGWQLIGRTALATFVPDREPPALLTPGTRVRFVQEG